MKEVLNNKNEFCVGSYKKVMYRPIGVPMKTQNREKIDIFIYFSKKHESRHEGS